MRSWISSGVSGLPATASTAWALSLTLRGHGTTWSSSTRSWGTAISHRSATSSRMPSWLTIVTASSRGRGPSVNSCRVFSLSSSAPPATSQPSTWS